MGWARVSGLTCTSALRGGSGGIFGLGGLGLGLDCLVCDGIVKLVEERLYARVGGREATLCAGGEAGGLGHSGGTSIRLVEWEDDSKQDDGMLQRRGSYNHYVRERFLVKPNARSGNGSLARLSGSVIGRSAHMTQPSSMDLRPS